MSAPVSAPVLVPLTRRGFGQTMRRDAWWVQPLVVFVILSAFVVYATWAAFQNAHYEFGPYLSPFYSPVLFGDSPHALVRAEARLVAGLAAVLAGAADPAVSAGCSASPATTTAAPTTRRSGPIRRAAPSASRARATSASAVSAHPPEHPPLLPVHRAALPRHPRARRVEGAVVRRRGTACTHFGIGVGTLVLRAQRRAARRLHARLPLAAPPRRRLSRPARRGRPVRKTAYDCVELPQSRAHEWAWMSLFWVAFTDVYVRLCSMGIWHDWRII